MGDLLYELGMDLIEMILIGGFNVIFVFIGYCLNVFGFLVGDDILMDNGGVVGGNFGFWD